MAYIDTLSILCFKQISKKYNKIYYVPLLLGLFWVGLTNIGCFLYPRRQNKMERLNAGLFMKRTGTNTQEDK